MASRPSSTSLSQTNSPPATQPLQPCCHNKNHAETVSLAAYAQTLLLPWMGDDPTVGGSHLWPPPDASQLGSPCSWGTLTGGAVQTQGKRTAPDPKKKNLPRKQDRWQGTHQAGGHRADESTQALPRQPRSTGRRALSIFITLLRQLQNQPNG